MTTRPGRLTPLIPTACTDANGTMWRLRSLVAMGHDCARIARALHVHPGLVRRVVRGQARTVTRGFHAACCQLWDAWWDKTPPDRSPAERRATDRALGLAKSNDWPAAAGLDEDELDLPGYRPWCRYRPATGTGIAADFPLPQRRPRQHTRVVADHPGTHAASGGHAHPQSERPSA
jgi:hypothetical protein